MYWKIWHMSIQWQIWESQSQSNIRSNANAKAKYSILTGLLLLSVQRTERGNGDDVGH